MCTFKKAGFALVELLTVIAIIALLAALLFPVFSRVREKSYQTGCMSNVKQIGTALKTYIQDTGGFMPTWCLQYNNPGHPPSNPNAAGYFTWDAQLMPYIKNEDLYICPSNPLAGDTRSCAIAHYTQTRLDGVPGGWGVMGGCYRASIPTVRTSCIPMDTRNLAPRVSIRSIIVLDAPTPSPVTSGLPAQSHGGDWPQPR